MKKIICSLAFIVLLSGCAALVIGSAAAVGTYTYKSGNLESTYNANLIATYNATIQACNSLNIFISKKEIGLSKASIKGSENGRDIWITLKTQSTTTTEASIRAGYFGDEFFSNKIHEAIMQKIQTN